MIFKRRQFESIQEFLVTADTDQDEVITEALDWLDAYA